MDRKKWMGKFRLENRAVAVIVVLFLTTAIIGVCGMHYSLLDSARVLGRDLVGSYIRDEELNLAKYRNQINLGMIYLKEMDGRNAGTGEKEEWIRDYFKKLREALPSDGVSAYAVLDGALIAETPWDGMEAFDYTQSVWYQKAFAAQGEVIFTDVYHGAAREDWVVSMAAVQPETGDAIILDLTRETFLAFHEEQSLPEDAAYYVCDTGGRLIYSNTHFSVPEDDAVSFAGRLFEAVRDGSITEEDNTVTGLDGERQGVYYAWVSNGWFAIMTMTHDALLKGLRAVFIWYIAVFFLFLVTAAVFGCKNRQLLREVRKEREIVQSLGNSYYAFYRVNVKNNSYEIIKGSEYINAKLPAKGEYTDLLHTLAGIMDEESGLEFLKSFSSEKIKELIGQKTEGFGGDFLRRFGEEYRWVNVSLLSDEILGDEEGVICFRKIHEEKQHQSEYQKLLQDALASAEMSEKSQRQFFASMSHEMKTPLNIIIGMADMAQRPGAGRDKTKECLEKIKGSARQLAALINDILENSRLDKGAWEQEQRFFDIEDAVLDCTEDFSVQAEEEDKGFLVDMQIANKRVRGNHLYLAQILNQLLSNAMKYTRAGDRIKVKVVQAGEEENLRFHFIVEDTGIGIPEEFLPKLFEPYATVKRFEKQKSGKGLGLAIVKNLVTQMGGAIHVQSELGKGTVFHVTLPFALKEREMEKPAGDVQPAVEILPEEGSGLAAGVSEPDAGEETPDGGKENGLKGCRILVAEDNPLNMEIAVELLHMAGAEVECAVNGQEAVELFEESIPGYYDAVVLDMQMPVLDGCGAAEAIRRMERPDARIVPIAALTANTLAEDVARTAHAGMNVHLAKPVMAKKLWDTLNELITEADKEKEKEKGG